LPRFLAEKSLEFSGPAIELFGLRQSVTLDRDIRPKLGIFSIQAQPIFQIRFGVGLNGLGRTFGFANATIYALVRMDHEHVFALVKTVDGANLDAIHVFAFDAVLGDHAGHRQLLGRGTE
jgi:hypothetical protein